MHVAEIGYPEVLNSVSHMSYVGQSLTSYELQNWNGLVSMSSDMSLGADILGFVGLLKQ